MDEAILIAPGCGEVIGDSPARRVEILSDHETLHATWSRFEPGREGADLHVHRLHTDVFYVLQGELTVRLGVEDSTVVVPAGKVALVPPNVVHGFRNGSDAELRYLNFHAPGQGFADYLRAIRDGRDFAYDQHPPPPDGGRAATDAVIGSDGLPAGVLADVDEIKIAEVQAAPDGLPRRPLAHDRVASFYVLEGELTVTAGDRRLQAAAGSWFQVPPGVYHSLTAEWNCPARFLAIRS